VIVADSETVEQHSADELQHDWITDLAVDLLRKRRRGSLEHEFRHASIAEIDAQVEYWHLQLDELPEMVAAGTVEPWIADAHECDCLERLELLEAELRRRVRLYTPTTYRARSRFDTNFARSLKERLDLGEYIVSHHSGTHLRRQGSRLVGLCPFHPEKTPSFTIFPGNGQGDRWYCFGCQRGGDVYAFLSELGVGFRQAVELVAHHLGIPMPKPVPHRERATGRGPAAPRTLPPPARPKTAVQATPPARPKTTTPIPQRAGVR
jgi:hypothetical protein